MALPTPDVDPVLADLAERGYETTCLDGATTPPAVAAGGDPPGAVTDRPLSVEPLAEATPLSLVAALADAARHERGALFVADPEAAAAAVEVLSDPFLLADERADGRVFYSIPDRIHLTDGTLAAVTARDPTWREDAPGGVTGDERALLLEADGETLAALESVAALTCPGPDPEAFPFRYARFRPLDMPLVPEHHLRENAGLARRWTVAVVDDGVEYVTP
ncbi:hypothetical protein BRC60_10570 [Halobacteriales archaeon QH_1_68_42]|nr:MAG: hypothetical protein BRC60_10570 [Halobacteriales archaeon QH_1_68_42]